MCTIIAFMYIYLWETMAFRNATWVRTARFSHYKDRAYQSCWDLAKHDGADNPREIWSLIKREAQLQLPDDNRDRRTDHTQNYKFATTVADLRHHRICDVIKGKRHGDI